MRTPKISPPAVAVQPKEGIITQVRTYRLITPLFGGGVEAGKYDPITPIRGTAIRGHLRFWWRACRGGKFGGSLDAMKAAEDAIWGAAANTETGTGPSQVQVVVQVANDGKDVHPFEVVPDKNNKPQTKPDAKSSVPAYAAFPLQPTREELRDGYVGMPTRAVRKGISFSLTITFSEQHRADVEAALWAWETFGGIGARTRRGFGALWLERVMEQERPVQIDRPRDSHAVETWIRQKLKEHVFDGSYPDNVPHLSSKTRFEVVSQTQQSVSGEWNALIEKLQKFRQQRRNKEGNPNSYGHSDWPEPNAIRRKVGRNARGPHANRRVDAFPRAQFGVPIIFHMPHDDDMSITLQGEGKDKDRLASPLILKPFAYQKDKAIGLALVLEGVHLPEPLALMGDDVPDAKREAKPSVSSDDAKRIPPLKGQTDILQAFLNFLKK